MDVSNWEYKREYYRKNAIKYGLKGESIESFLSAIGYGKRENSKLSFKKLFFL